MIGAGVFGNRCQANVAGRNSLEARGIMDVLNRLNQILKRGLGHGAVGRHRQGVHAVGLTDRRAPTDAGDRRRRVHRHVGAINHDDFVGRIGNARHRQIERRKAVARLDCGQVRLSKQIDGI